MRLLEYIMHRRHRKYRRRFNGLRPTINFSDIDSDSDSDLDSDIEDCSTLDKTKIIKKIIYEYGKIVYVKYCKK